MIKILFLIHDLGQGGAEKVLVNLVNHLDRSKFHITVTTLFGGGVNEQFLKKDIRVNSIFPKEIPGNSKLMKLLTPKMLHKLCVKEYYDIEVSYLEGPSARVISGCQVKNTRLISWIHVEQHTIEKLSASFRSKKEALQCYNRFDHTVCVSQYVRKDFCKILDFKKPCSVLYNTVESEQILELSKENAEEIVEDGRFRLIAVGTLKQSKGYMRLLQIVKRLYNEKYPIHLYVLGIGPLQQEMENFINHNKLHNVITLLGYQTNPYKYVKKCDLFVCASFAEGFSTAATEALIVGTPVCTVEVSGMREMLGEHNEFGMITPNTEKALYEGIRKLLDNQELLAYYRKQSLIRSTKFTTDQTVRAVEDLLLSV